MNARLLSCLLVLLSLGGCKKSDHYIALKEINERTAMFDVANLSDTDAMAMDFELTYMAPNDSVILVDTVEFTQRGRDGTPGVFLKAGDTTFFAQRIPEGTTTASGRVIGVR